MMLTSRVFAFSVVGLGVGSVVLLALARLEWLPVPPAVLASSVGAFMVGLTVELVKDAITLARVRGGRLARTGRAVAVLGALLFFGGGLVNWLFSLQGYLIVTEGEGVPLGHREHLGELEKGPLADLAELGMVLELVKVELEPHGQSFVPLSTLALATPGHSKEQIHLKGSRDVRVGSLRLQQGAFGFAPRIVILHNGETVLDKYVPFTTQGEGGRFNFFGSFSVSRDRLKVDGSVLVDSLDEEGRGHARLGLTVHQSGQLLGTGELKPGYFADLDQGFRIGFAGLKHWVEIDLSRRNYSGPMLAGLMLCLCGCCVVLWARLRRR